VITRALLAQMRVEVRLTLRRGENILITLLIPAAVLVAFGAGEGTPVGYASTVDFLLPGVLALAVMSTGMVSLGIATAYERYYRVLKRLGATPLGRLDLLAAKIGGVLVVEALQVAVLVGLGAGLGWRPSPTVWAALPLLALGSACFAALGLLMAGALRAEATLGLANILYLGFLAAGGIVAPLDRLPSRLAEILRLLPATALARALRDVMAHHSLPDPLDPLVVLLWTGAAIYLAMRTFRWE
jgi:ABC-2 type transport system permease protein